MFFRLVELPPTRTFYSNSLWIAEAIVKLDKNTQPTLNPVNDKYLADLKFIAENTHPKVMMPLADVESIVASKPLEQWRTSIDLQDNKGDRIRINDIKETTVIDLNRMLKESYRSCLLIVVDIAKDYSLDYRTAPVMGSYDVPEWMAGGATQQPQQ